MIPASYLFRDLYRDTFEAAEAAPDKEASRPRGRPGRDRHGLDQVSAAILGFAFGAAQLPLHAAMHPYPRRR